MRIHQRCWRPSCPSEREKMALLFDLKFFEIEHQSDDILK